MSTVALRYSSGQASVNIYRERSAWWKREKQQAPQYFSHSSAIQSHWKQESTRKKLRIQFTVQWGNEYAYQDRLNDLQLFATFTAFHNWENKKNSVKKTDQNIVGCLAKYKWVFADMNEQ